MIRRYLLLLTLALMANTSFAATFGLEVSLANLRDKDGNLAPIGSFGMILVDTQGIGFNIDQITLDGLTVSDGLKLDNGLYVLKTLDIFEMDEGIIGVDTYYFTHPFADGIAPGQQIAFLWFPDISFNVGGVTIGEGVSYGFYRTDEIDIPSGSNSGWFIPALGANNAIAAWDKVLLLSFDPPIPGGKVTQADLTANLETVPEPATWALMLGGLGALALLRRRKAQA